jgi:hypothetical protein
MRRIGLALFLVLAITYSVARVRSALLERVNYTKDGLKVIVPTAIWEPIFFNSIYGRAGSSHLPNLRGTLLSGDDLEVRI